MTRRGNEGTFFDTDNILFPDVAHRMANVFFKEPGSIYFRLGGPVSVTTTQILLL